MVHMRALVLGGLLAAGCGSSLAAAGDEAFAAKRYEDAVARYAEARQGGDASPELARKAGDAATRAAADRRRQAETAEAANDLDGALAHLDKALTFTPDDQALLAAREATRGKAGEAAYRQAESATGKGAHEEAAAALRRALAAKPGERLYTQALGRALASRGAAFATQKDWPAAIAALQEAVAVDAENVEAKDALAQAQDRQNTANAFVATGEKAETDNDYDAAAKAYEEALGLWPGHPSAAAKLASVQNNKNFLEHFRVGKAHIEARRWNDALTSFNEAAKYQQTTMLTEQRDLAYREKYAMDGELAASEEKWDKAIEAWEQAARHTPEKSEAAAAITGKIRKASRQKFLAVGMSAEVARKWIEAHAAYAKAQEFTDPGDGEIARRVLEVNSHLVRVQCEACLGKGKVEKFKLEGNKQIPAGEAKCVKCDGSGQRVQVKAGN